jgi:hypothetical protein
MVLPAKFAGATVLEESANLIKIETASGQEFWIPRNNSAAPKSEPRAGRRGKQPTKLGFRDKDGVVYYNAAGQERLQRAFAARPRSF